MASGDTSTCSTTCVTFAANCANVVWASLQEPKVTRARKSLPVIFDARLTKPVRRAVASMSSEEKKSVNMANAPNLATTSFPPVRKCPTVFRTSEEVTLRRWDEFEEPQLLH